MSSSPTLHCLVCCALTNSSHLGVDICRSCSAFYKRCRRTKKKWPCRAGDGSCRPSVDITKCKGCRLSACTRLITQSKKQSKVPSPPSPATPTAPSTLELIGQRYRLFCDRRRECERALRIANRYGAGMIELPSGKTVHQATALFESDAMTILNVELVRFLEDAFPTYARLSDSDKNSVFTNCVMCIRLIESFWQIFQYAPDSDNLIFCGIDRAMDTLKVEDFFMGFKTPAGKRASDLVDNKTAEYWLRHREIIYPLLKRAQLSEHEYHALIGMICWSQDNTSSLSVDVVETACETRNVITSDLMTGYPDSAEGSVRIGQIMTIAHAVKESSALVKEEFQLYSVMDILPPECHFYRTFVEDAS